MWPNPHAAAELKAYGAPPSDVDAIEYRDAFDDFYEEIYSEFEKFGKIEEVVVAGNLGDHLLGNVYVKYFDEEDTQKALTNLNGRFYAGRPLKVEYSPVTDFREARCRQFDERNCNRGGLCNFMHLMDPHRSLRSLLRKNARDKEKSSSSRRRSRSKSRSKSRDRRSRRRSRSRSRSRHRRYSRRRSRSRDRR